MSATFLSPSQVDTWLLCKRKWAWRYIAKIETPPHPSAAKGTAVHKQLSEYLLNGTPLDFTSDVGYIAAAALPHLPAPMTAGLEIEKYFTFQDHKGINWRGFKDWTLAPIDGRNAIVGDHKTTGDLRWAKTEEDLLHDAQAMLYAYDTMGQYRTPIVDLQWTYLQTRAARRVKVVRLTVEQTHVVKVFHELQNIGLEILDAKQSNQQPLDFPATPTACEAFGGCPYRDRCNLSATDRLIAVMTQASETLFARLKTKASSVAPPPSSPAPSPSPALAETVLVEIPADPPVPAIDLVATTEFAINPPEWQPAPTAEERAATPPPPPVTEPATPKAKRTKKSDVSGNTVTPVTAGVSLPLPGMKTVYVDCLPNKPVMLAEKVYEKARAIILEQRGLADYRFADYGSGAGMLASAVGAILDDVWPGDVMVSSRTPEGQICLSVFLSRADLVIRGL